jgi:hypothetical protein
LLKGAIFKSSMRRTGYDRKPLVERDSREEPTPFTTPFTLGKKKRDGLRKRSVAYDL